jgi:hypothetical protein
MRKFLMTATILTVLGFATAGTAMADGHTVGNSYASDNGYSQGYGNGHNNDYDDNDAYDQGQQGYVERDEDRAWERSWHRGDGYGYQGQVLPYWKLERRIERQGYFHIRNLHPSRFGFGWKAFARDRFRRPVMLRVNPYSGRVLDVRVLYRHF